MRLEQHDLPINAGSPYLTDNKQQFTYLYNSTQLIMKPRNSKKHKALALVRTKPGIELCRKITAPAKMVVFRCVGHELSKKIPASAECTGHRTVVRKNSAYLFHDLASEQQQHVALSFFVLSVQWPHSPVRGVCALPKLARIQVIQSRSLQPC